FPHAIIHEASITFLGFGLSVQTPSIGLILSEAVKHISIGDWWLAFFPGLILVCVVKSFDNIGEHFRLLINPASANE
ncbi:MAG: ABC transporter permease, partial [Firmicutes bacterium]|nr:ABC transporter permease [Bacillota bacterium]